jgi:hypothetical protein
LPITPLSPTNLWYNPSNGGLLTDYPTGDTYDIEKIITDELTGAGLVGSGKIIGGP